MIWFLLTLLFWLPFMNHACTTVKTCLHNGSFNTKTCQCECYAAYKGLLRFQNFLFNSINLYL
jgi:hypothetical protein